MRLPTALRKDRVLYAHIRRIGPLDASEWHRPRNPFHSLIRSIIHQQVSGKAAASITARFQAAFGGTMPSPEAVLRKPVSELRAAGLSASKTKYILDLAAHFADGRIKPRRFKTLPNEAIIAQLTAVHGIGVWTAHMFLIFTLKRPDILPTLDLGIRKGFQITYALPALPSHDQMLQIATPWAAHASQASLYLWRIADAAKK